MNRVSRLLSGSRSRLLAVFNQAPAAPDAADVRSNLPRPPHDGLVGRDDDVRALIGELRATSSFVLLYGPAGSGKSTLAFEVARQTIRHGSRSGFSAAVWLPARPAIHTVDGFLQSPLACGDLDSFVTNICATIGSQDILKELPEKQPALLRAVLAERRVLLLADDLDEVADPQVLPFLTSLPAGTTVLATSRRELDAPTRFRVEPLNRRDSARLIDALLRNDRALTPTTSRPNRQLSEVELDELFSITGGIPLALVWATSLVRMGAQTTHVVEQFTDSDSEILHFCFSAAWRQIDGTLAASVLGVLALFSSGAHTQMLADACGLRAGSREYSDALLAIRRLGLVENLSDRLALLPMTRSYVVTSIFGDPPDPRSEALRTQWADALSRYVSESLLAGEVTSCFARLESERANIEELLTWATSREDTYARARAAVVYHDTSYFLFSRGYWTALSSHAEWAVPELWKQGLLEEAIGVLLTWVARVCLLRDDQVGMQDCFDLAREMISRAPAEEVPLLQAIFDFNAASVRQREGDDPQGVELLRSSVREFENAGRAEWLARSLNRLGNVLSARGEYPDARAAYEAAIAAGAVVEETALGREVVAIARGNRGILANREGDSESAKTFLREVESLIDQTMDGATLLMELAIAEYRSGQEREAYRLGVAALAKARHLQVGVTLAESDANWEKAVFPRLAERYEGRRGGGD